MTIDWRRWRPLLIATGHVLGALLVAYLFLVVLMTASLQSNVAAGLERLQPTPLEYSTAYGQWQESKRIDAVISALVKRRAKLVAERDAASVAVENATDDAFVLDAPVFALSERLNTYYDCKIDTGGTRADMIEHLRQCAAEVPPADSIHGEMTRILTNAKELLEVNRKLQHSERTRVRQAAKVATATRAIALQRAEQAELEQARDQFDTMASLEHHWLPGGDMLIELPPPIINIVLAFVSGMFGGLLLTMVFVVYPETSLSLTTRAAAYGPRILLGGLISLCVFVVVGGGTAVLGSNDTLAGGDANFLAFCAIGILAGMFSDRVATWLSERANDFFKATQQGADSQRRDGAADGPGEQPAAEGGEAELTPEVKPDQPADEPGASIDDPDASRA
jgi:hypothetical protein